MSLVYCRRPYCRGTIWHEVYRNKVEGACSLCGRSPYARPRPPTQQELDAKARDEQVEADLISFARMLRRQEQITERTERLNAKPSR